MLLHDSGSEDIAIRVKKILDSAKSVKMVEVHLWNIQASLNDVLIFNFYLFR
ncbi:hypothetical protein NUACC26_003430 [Scytonema sp. NUACC26]